MEGLEESECNAIIGPDNCLVCGLLISSEWQLNHPGIETCEHHSTVDLYQDEDNFGAC